MTTTKPPVFVATDERCGGTTLARVLRLVTDGAVIDDPFNRIAHHDKYLSSTRAEIDDGLRRLLETFIGVKCCVCLHEIPDYLYLLEKAIDTDCKIVFLWRKNLLHRALSRGLAIATGVWSRYDNDHRPTVPDRPYETSRVEMDMELLQEDIEIHRSKMTAVRSYLEDRDLPYFDLEYSTIYGHAVDMERRLERVRELCRFLEIDPDVVEAKRRDLAYKGYLLPRAKLNSLDRYSDIANVDEIEARLSHPDNGLLWEVE